MMPARFGYIDVGNAARYVNSANVIHKFFATSGGYCARRHCTIPSFYYGFPVIIYANSRAMPIVRSRST